MVKKILIISFLLTVSFLVKPLYAQSSGFGLGVILGEPTGICGKYWLANGNALDFGLGYSFSSVDSRVNLHVDYLFHSYDAIKTEEKFILYYGGGIRIKTIENEDDSFGLRGVIGIDWFLHKSPVDVFVEIAPVVKLIPKTALDLDAGIGVRYFF